MGRPGKVNRAYIAGNAGLVLGYAAVLVRDLATPDIITATDFTVFWSAWWMVAHGRASALYDEAAQRATQTLLMGGGYFEGGLMSFLNPPHFALATLPFGWLADRAGEQAAFVAWTVVNLALLAILARMLLAEWGPAARQHRWTLVVALLAFYPVFVTVKNGQLSLVLALAIMGVYRAEQASRHWVTGAWVAVLTIKPQLVPVVVMYLAARRSWRALACAAICIAGVVAATAAALGPSIWIEYARHVHYLEQFWGSGTPDYMLNVRGELTRLFGLDRRATIDAAAMVVWLAGMAVVAARLWRRRLDREADTRSEYAFAIAIGLFANPHLFIHDTVIWTVPLLLATAALRDAGADWRRFAAFALAWPAVFAIAGRLDIRSGPWTLFDLHTWTFVAAIVLIARQLPPIAIGVGRPDTARVFGADLYRSWTS